MYYCSNIVTQILRKRRSDSIEEYNVEQSYIENKVEPVRVPRLVIRGKRLL